ncbi:DNA polymerase Y family protein [Xenophilus arseniciresistens]|uniref:DNA polymerase Y family protein n=1 Tax=Xenophilus arseniciresistens TaxID=1283306 RepID=A0AAE3T0T6_9BURK|nr:DNA polymerase Y family protein [Xenophilus arseniciresistens]MDA7417291.1 DNA polymerase Y family protein [Xenophilus arseniciresistens]
MHWIALHWSAPEAAVGTPPAVARDAELPDAQALGWWALQFTPHVAWCEEALMLEVSACERLWGGRQALMRQMAADAPEGLRPRQAQGASSLVALARLRLYCEGQQPPARLPHALPLRTLDAARPHLNVLARLGCQTWGDVAALPRAGVVRRFGAELREALDVAWGLRPDRLPWLSVPETFDQKAELPALATSGPELLWSAQRLMSALRLWLQARQRGVLAFELEWTLDLKRLQGVDLPRTQHLLVRTAEPTQDMAHLRRLLAERLALVTLLAPTGWLRLRSIETAPWGGAARSLLPPRHLPARDGKAQEAGQPGAGEPLHQLVEKLSARLGPQAVQVPVPQADHRPERMQRWAPAVHSAGPGTPCAAPEASTPISALLPTWLLPEPLPLDVRDGRPHYHGQLKTLVGPQRLEGDGWWEPREEGADAQAPGAAVARDYYIARSPQAGLVWIYRERTTLHGAGQVPRWFLQGLYA